MNSKTAGIDAFKWAAVGLLFTLLPAQRAAAQFGFSSQFELSPAIQLNEADGAVQAHFARIKAFLAAEQWDEAVETLRSVMETQGDRMIAVAENRYISVRNFCHLQIAQLPPEGLELYRQRVDPIAKRWFDEGKAGRDVAKLQRVVDQFFASSYGDDALLVLGELAFERGEVGEARRNWEQISPLLKTGGVHDGRPLWWATYGINLTQHWEKLKTAFTLRGQPPTWVVYPDTDLNLSSIRARLVLASIIEMNTARAKIELEILKQLDPNAQGKLGGKEVVYAERLGELLTTAAEQETPKPQRQWPTFDGSSKRQAIAASLTTPAGVAWKNPIQLGPAPLMGDIAVDRALGFGGRRASEDVKRLLSYHPIVVGNLLITCNQYYVYAHDLATGEPAWNNGVLYRDETAEFGPARHSSRIGVPRFTLTSHGNKVFARIGEPVTSWPPDDPNPPRPGSLVCLDLDQQGALVWKIEPDGGEWSFEGSPICDGAYVYVAMRRSDVRPQAHVACFDARTGNLLWRQSVCAAETPARGQVEEITHNLLTLAEGTIYYNTNLGAVAALSARDGQIRWITLYPRATRGDLANRAAHYYRDLNPCVYDRGTLLVAPSDCEQIVALDADTGQTLWLNSRPEDVVHLVGVQGDRLLASGDRLWWLDIRTGKPVNVWPESVMAGPRGFGRGVIAGSEVYFPTRDRIYVFDCKTATTTQEPLVLSQLGIDSGNLLAADELLLVAGPQKLYALGPQSQPEPPIEETVTQRPSRPESTRISHRNDAHLVE